MLFTVCCCDGNLGLLGLFSTPPQRAKTDKRISNNKFTDGDCGDFRRYGFSSLVFLFFSVVSRWSFARSMR
jgi:hypothetical protein